jgi:hypothetical protein
MKKTTIITILLILAVLFMSCTAGPNSIAGVADADGEVAGFLMGLWHGCISFITFVISLFSDKVNVYEVHNNGGWYNFGFVLGAMIAYGGSGSGACKKRKKWGN